MENKKDATIVVKDELENKKALNEQVSNPDEDENPLPQNPDAQDDDDADDADDADDENIIIGKVNAEGNEEILKAVLKKYPQYASEKTATITMISGITELTDYDLVTLKLDKKLPKMVASKEDEEVFEESTSRNVQIIFGSFLAAMTEHRLFARGVNFLKKDHDLLYSWAVGLTVKILILRIPDGMKWAPTRSVITMAPMPP